MRTSKRRGWPTVETDRRKSNVDDLSTWLLEQVTDDERVAQCAIVAVNAKGHWDTPFEAGANWTSDGGMIFGSNGMPMWECEGSDTLCMADEWADHAAHYDPARVLAECESKRRIIEACRPSLLDVSPVHQPNSAFIPGAGPPWGEPVLRLLALPYADRSGYREEWKL
jgi:hypothetical protein